MTRSRSSRASSRRTSRDESNYGEQELESTSVYSVSTGTGTEARTIQSRTGSEPKAPKQPRWTAVVLGIFGAVILLVVGFLCGVIFRHYYKGSLFGSRDDNMPAISANWKNSLCALESQDSCRRSIGSNPLLIVINVPGIHKSFLERNLTPVVESFKDCGFPVSSLVPATPSKSLPNQYTIVTGLFPENHGIVDDRFLDPLTGLEFNGQSSDQNFWGGEPIWVTAKKQGKRVFVDHWAGSEMVVQGVRPDNFTTSSDRIHLSARIDRIKQWMKLSTDRRPHLILVQFDEIAQAGAMYGTKGREFDSALGNFSLTVESLLVGIHDAGLSGCVNLIVTSDHGVVDMDCSKSIDVISIISRNISWISENDIRVFPGPQARLAVALRSTTSGRLDEQQLHQALSCSAPGNLESSNLYDLFTRDTTPVRLHYTNSDRIEPLILSGKKETTIWKSRSARSCLRGIGGFDPIDPNMHGTLLFFGPAFKTSTRMDHASTVDLYNLLCELIDIIPAENNGSLGAFNRVLKEPKVVKLATVYRPETATFPAVYVSSGDCTERCGMIGGTLTDADQRLNMPANFANQLTFYHSQPYGLPQSGIDPSVVLLVGRDFLSGFSRERKLASWASSSFTATQQIVWNERVEVGGCQRPDPRLRPGESLRCEDFFPQQSGIFGLIDRDHIVQPVYLVPVGLSTNITDSSDGKVISNIVPMFPAFIEFVWTRLWNQISKWSLEKLPLNVITGPVFDHNSPRGSPDSLDNRTFAPYMSRVPLPSHFFMIIVRRNPACVETGCEHEVLGFVLPHRKERTYYQCQVYPDYFLLHSATVKDIERITGLTFFTDLTTSERIRLVNFIPLALWAERY